MLNSSFSAMVNQLFQSPTLPTGIPAVNRIGRIKFLIISKHHQNLQGSWLRQFYHIPWDRAFTAITDCCVCCGWPRLCSIIPLHTMAVRCNDQQTLANHKNSRDSLILGSLENISWVMDACIHPTLGRWKCIGRQELITLPYLQSFV